MERRCLERVIEEHPAFVLATGGSIVSEPATFERLLGACRTVWLKASPDEHMTRVVEQGDMRPMAGNRESMDDLKRILAGREPLYRRADVAVDTSGKTTEESLNALAAALAAG
jgi:XRE family aerobic/anaerobic benzoate catabolism transcriptional regulator